MMEINFKDTIRFESDFYVGDYNEYAKNHKDCQYIGVTISEEPLTDIQSLHFINKQHIPVLAINFEKNCRGYDISGYGDIRKFNFAEYKAYKAIIHGMHYIP